MTSDHDAVPKVRVIVLNYNGGKIVEQAFEALTETDWPASRLELVMVDNASTDNSREAVATRFDNVKIIDSATNNGFPANNLALRDLDGVDHLALINNDAFVSPGWLRPLVAQLESTVGTGAACPKIVLAETYIDIDIDGPVTKITGIRINGAESLGRAAGDGISDIESSGHSSHRWSQPPGSISVPIGTTRDLTAWQVEIDFDGDSVPVLLHDGTAAEPTRTKSGHTFSLSGVSVGYDMINNAGSVLLTSGYGADRGYLQPDGPPFDKPCEVFAWCGAAVLFRKEYLAHVGLFDESFFMYYEDTDLSFRGQRAGWTYDYVPSSVVHHMHAATAVEGSAMFRHYNERNRLAMLTKNAPRRLLFASVVSFLRGSAAAVRDDVVRPIGSGKRPRYGRALARAKSFGAWLLMTPRLLRARRALKRSAVVTDAEIEARLAPTPRVEVS